jgi:presenilin 1
MGSRPPVSSIELEDISAERRQRNVESRRSQRHDEKEKELKYGAAHVIRLFVPVSLCMAMVIFTMNTIGYFSRDDGVYLIYTPFTQHTENTTELLVMSVGNALTVLAVVVVMTGILIMLYYFRFYKVIHGWLLLSSILLLSLFTTMYLQELFKNFNTTIDYITFGFFIWNFAALGILCIHWKGPLLLQQTYLIVMSALMALVLIKYLPDWTVWTVLGALSIWDLIAVLCPHGPLRMLVETAQKRNEPIFPALIYSSAVLYPYVIFGASRTDPNNPNPKKPKVSFDSSNETSRQPLLVPSAETTFSEPSSSRSDKPDTPTVKTVPRQAPVKKRSSLRVSQGHDSQPRPRLEEIEVEEVVEEQGVKLGLGDFIFYSVLVGKASSYGDWNTTIAVYVAILIGLAFTLMLLAVFRKALPALPISIFAGMVFYFSSREFITPFMNELTIRQINGMIFL